jgi:heptose I phosphotransferase
VHGVRRLRQRSDWVDFAGPGWDERIMESAVTDRFHAKQGRSVGRWILHAADGRGGPSRRLSVYLKRHYELPWWRRLLALMWPGGCWSPAMQEWQHLEWARRQGVPVPEVVAAGELIGPWGRFQSFLAVEELADMLPLHEAIPLAAEQLAPAVFRRWKRALVVEMARLTRMLHDRRYFHKDLYLCHFYIASTDCLSPPEGWRGRVFLIDLHRLAHHPWTWRVWQLKDLAQLLYSSEVVGVDTRDRLAFWREYRGPGPNGRGQSWLRRLVVLKWRRYQRHNARHKHLRPGAEQPGEAA